MENNFENINNQPLQEQELSDTVPFAYQEVTEEAKSIIKVVGVGGGGSNAVENMYREGAGIQDVSFLIINTDKAALKASKIPNKLQISKEGLGAGAQPEVAQQYAVESEDAIRAALSDGTKMVFITAGMGGGTGTGASPVVAKIAHELGILTIGIVTIPFKFEGQKKILMALKGVAAIRQYVDALLVVNNNRLVEIYPDLNFFNAFKKADDTLTVAAKSISDIINVTGYMNLDFADVEKTLKDSGVALISTGVAQGEGRVTAAIKEAISSPLLQDNQITHAKRLLFELCFSESNPVSMAEIGELSNFVDGLSSEIEVIWGAMVDNTLGDDVRIIVLASGFDVSDIDIEAPEVTLEAERKAAEEEARRQAEAAAQKAEADRKAAEEEAQRQAAIAAEKEDAERQSTQDALDAQKKLLEDQMAARLAEMQRMHEQQMAAMMAQFQATLSNTATTAAAPAVSETPVVEAPVEPKPTSSASTPQQASTPIEGINSIRRFYGEETANGIIQNDVRSRYYLMDDKDLTNEQLIELLERMPSYNRTSEQFQQLKEVSARGGINQHRNNENLDGTIHF
ncbi:MAG: cell division protein FtsZ [Bacteroidales bacterium]|nr:cell division protein FtsZ [Bacteroidales bacterium]